MRACDQNQLYAHIAKWELIPQKQRRDALRKQQVALAVRICLRNGMTDLAAMNWVIGLNKLSQRVFWEEKVGNFANGDELYLWQFKEILKLRLADDFATKRKIQQWVLADEPWLFDERWSYPTHLVGLEYGN